MKILQISSAQSFGGGERHIVDLMNALFVRGHEVYAVVRPDSVIPSRLNASTRKNIRVLPMRNALDVPSANELARFVKQNAIEVIHAHMARDYSLAAYAARRSRAKLILTRHVLFPLNRLHRRIFSNASGVIAVSEAVRRTLIRQKFVAESRVTVVHNGVDMERFNSARLKANRAELCSQWDLPVNSLLVGTIGQLNPLKGHDVFLKAAALVTRDIPQARFLIAGEDPSERNETEAALKRSIGELKIQEYVRLLGHINDVAPLLAVLDIFVSASQSESLGVAIIEAMASGVPVVATETEGAREVIRDRETGFLVPINRPELLAQSLIDLLGDKQLRQRMGQLACEDVGERFRLDRMVDAIEAIYRGNN